MIEALKSAVLRTGGRGWGDGFKVAETEDKLEMHLSPTSTDPDDAHACRISWSPCTCTWPQAVEELRKKWVELEKPRASHCHMPIRYASTSMTPRTSSNRAFPAHTFTGLKVYFKDCNFTSAI